MMKTTKLLMVILLFVLSLAGCSSGTDSIRTFELEKDGVKSTLVYTFQGDKVSMQTTENIITYKEVGFNSKDEAKEYFDPIISDFQNYDGLVHTMEYGEEAAVERITIDYDSIGFKEIQDLPGMSFDGDLESEGISMEKSAELLFGQGFEEIK